MYIHRIKLYGVRSVKDRDFILLNDWTQEPLKSVLFTGPNGSGKTTVLQVIANLWAGLEARFIQKGISLAGIDDSFSWANVGFAAVEIHELIDQPIWVYHIDHTTYQEEDFFDEDDLRVDIQQRGEMPSPISMDLMNLNNNRQGLLVGSQKAELIPNIVYLPAESRFVQKQQRRPEVSAELLYAWLAVYKADDRNLETILLNHKPRDLDDFERILQQVNQFLVDKEITDFNSNNRLVVKTKDGHQHLFSDLSAGEKQALLLLFWVSRWMMPGGIVLIDEPDLHLHVSLQQQLIHALEKIVVKEKGGQLIVTSHSLTVWKEYSRHHRIELSEKILNVQPG